MINDGKKKKLVRVTTVPISLKVLLKQQLKFMSSHFDVLAVSSPGPTLQEVAVQEGVKTVAVEMTRSITPLKDLKALWELYNLFKKERPSIVHTHTPKAGLLGMMAGKLAGVPIRMHTVAGMPLMESIGGKRKVLEYVERLTYKSATKVYPNSKKLAQFILEQKFCNKDKLKVLGNGSSNGIDTDYFKLDEELSNRSKQIRTDLGINEHDFVFVFIGRLVKDKGIEELVAAFIELKKKFSGLKLLLVGPYEQELDPLSEQTINAIKEQEGIITVGFQKDVRPYYVVSDVLTFPTYREGFPNVPMQAGCFDLPSIVTDINGCNEIIEDGKNGLVIPVKDKEALQEAMQRLILDKKLFSDLKANARKMILERFDQKYLWDLILQEYNEQLELNAVS